MHLQYRVLPLGEELKDKCEPPELLQDESQLSKTASERSEQEGIFVGGKQACAGGSDGESILWIFFFSFLDRLHCILIPCNIQDNVFVPRTAEASGRPLSSTPGIVSGAYIVLSRLFLAYEFTVLYFFLLAVVWATQAMCNVVDM